MPMREILKGRGNITSPLFCILFGDERSDTGRCEHEMTTRGYPVTNASKARSNRRCLFVERKLHLDNRR
jgi:hypothetical protein